MQTRTKAGIVVGAVALALLTGCNSYRSPRGTSDAPIGNIDSSPADIIEMANGWGNVATKCDGHGHRLYVMTHAKTDSPVTVIVDPSCPGGKVG